MNLKIKLLGGAGDEKNMTELICKESITIQEGKHTGIVQVVEDRTTPQGYEYIDVYVTVDELKDLEDEPFTIKYGCPRNLSEASKLGKLLKNFVDIKPGEKYDPKTILENKKVSYLTVEEKGTDGNSYAKIVEGSLKPIQE